MFSDYINYSDPSPDLQPFGRTRSTDYPLHPTYMQITRELGFCKPEAHHADEISSFLEKYFSSRSVRITGLRTGIIPTNGLININDNGDRVF